MSEDDGSQTSWIWRGRELRPIGQPHNPADLAQDILKMIDDGELDQNEVNPALLKKLEKMATHQPADEPLMDSQEYGDMLEILSLGEEQPIRQFSVDVIRRNKNKWVESIDEKIKYFATAIQEGSITQVDEAIKAVVLLSQLLSIINKL